MKFVQFILLLHKQEITLLIKQVTFDLQVKLDANISEFPINLQILSLVSKKSADEICEKKGLKSKFESDPAVSPIVAQIEQSLFEYSSFLHLEENAADGQLTQISSNCLSRTVQRKIFKLLCNQVYTFNCCYSIFTFA